MDELHQSDDFFIPKLFLLEPPQSLIKERITSIEKFLNNFQGWADIIPLDECVA